jgi:hypothetical protein
LPGKRVKETAVRQHGKLGGLGEGAAAFRGFFA